jgi:glycosyltransferase involved in cell wall biosynthesis
MVVGTLARKIPAPAPRPEKVRREIVQPKKVLVITFAFPPMPQVASLRMKGLANYLGEFGWEPVFITASPPDAANSDFRNIYVPFPGTVLNSICNKLSLKKLSTNIERKKQKQNVFYERKNSFVQKLANIFNSFVAYPDHFRLWLPRVVKVVEKLMHNEKFDAILTTSPPVITNLVASKLKRKFGLPWVADFRDLWSQNHYYPYNKLRQFIDAKLEKKVLKYADGLVTISEPLAAQLKNIHKDKVIKTITNGYDPRELKNSGLANKFFLTYTGKLYYGKPDPEFLFVALRDLIDNSEISSENFLLRFYGAKLPWLENLILKYSLQDFVQQFGYTKREMIFEKQRESQALLLLNGTEAENFGVYTGKVFEYLAAQRPILYLGGVENDVISRLLQETNTGVRAQNIQEVKNVIRKWYSQFLKEGAVSYEGKMQKINKYSHREMARKFADLLEEVSSKNHQ